jgi:hypothetical protein
MPVAPLHSTMPFKATGPATDLEAVDRWDGGVSWFAHPGETMQRTSHALATDAGVWLVDPLDAAGLDELLADLGDVVGVVVTMDRHTRDAAALARRHDAPVWVQHPGDTDLDASTRTLGNRLADTPFEVLEVVSWPGWREVALFDGETLVVGDALGTAPHFVAGDETLGLHPFLRVAPPSSLRGLRPERILVGHGAGVTRDAPAALERAFATARRNLPRAWLGALKSLG